ALVHLELVVHVLHAGAPLDDVLGRALLLTVFDLAGERDFAVVDLNLDLAGIDLGMAEQLFAHVLANAIVGALVTLRPAAVAASNDEGARVANAGASPGLSVFTLAVAALAVAALAVAALAVAALTVAALTAFSI